MRRLRELVDGLLPPSLREADAPTVRSAHLALTMGASTVLWGPVFILVYAWLGMGREALVVAVGTVYLATLPFVLRRTASLSLAAHHTASALWFVVVGLSLLTGGLYASAPPWLMTLSFLGLAIGGWRPGVIWLVVGMASVVGFMGADLAGVSGQTPPREMSVWLHGFSLIGVCTFLFLLGTVFQVEAESMGKRLESQVTQLSEANRAKSLFLANMSHELRTPMNAILGYSELIAEDLEEDAGADVLPDVHRVHDAGRHLLALIDDLLDLSRIEIGVIDLDIGQHDLAGITNDVVDRLRPFATASSTDLVLELDVTFCACDPIRTAQIVTNLVHNAVKFDAGGRVVIRCGVEGARAWVEVEDRGPGLTQAELDAVFDEFQQAHPAVRAEHGGTGLGLTISRHLARAMRGDVVGRGSPGAGCAFRLELPTA